MISTTRQPIVSIAPSSCRNDTEGTVNVTCEDIVSERAAQERRRNLQTVGDEAETRVRYRTTPFILLPLLAAFCDSGPVSDRRVITKCLSHHLIALLEDIPELPAISRMKSGLIRLNGKHGGLSDLIDQVDTPTYRFATPRDKPGEFRSVEVITKRLSALVSGSGIAVNTAFSIGLLLTLSTTKRQCLLGITAEASAEIERFKQFLDERVTLLSAYSDIAGRRLRRLHANSTRPT